MLANGLRIYQCMVYALTLLINTKKTSTNISPVITMSFVVCIGGSACSLPTGVVNNESCLILQLNLHSFFQKNNQQTLHLRSYRFFPLQTWKYKGTKSKAYQIHAWLIMWWMTVTMTMTVIMTLSQGDNVKSMVLLPCLCCVLVLVVSLLCLVCIGLSLLCSCFFCWVFE